MTRHFLLAQHGDVNPAYRSHHSASEEFSTLCHDYFKSSLPSTSSSHRFTHTNTHHSFTTHFNNALFKTIHRHPLQNSRRPGRLNPTSRRRTNHHHLIPTPRRIPYIRHRPSIRTPRDEITHVQHERDAFRAVVDRVCAAAAAASPRVCVG